MDDAELRALKDELYPVPPAGMVRGIRTGAGNMLQLPADIAKGAGVGNVFPDTMDSIQRTLAEAGNYVAGYPLGADKTPEDTLMQAMRSRLQAKSDPASRAR